MTPTPTEEALRKIAVIAERRAEMWRRISVELAVSSRGDGIDRVVAQVMIGHISAVATLLTSLQLHCESLLEAMPEMRKERDVMKEFDTLMEQILRGRKKPDEGGKPS